MEWKTLSSEYLFKDLWFTVRKDTCERPDGKIISPYYVYEFPNWVAAMALTRDGKVILEKQYRHASGLTLLEIPGGCVDDTDKSYEEAIARELREETGYVFDSYEYLGRTSANPSTNNNWLHMFLARGGVLTHDQEMDDHEDIVIELHEVEEVRNMLREGRFLQSMHATTLFHALDRLGQIRF